MENLFQYVVENKEWLFSGLGLLVLGGVIKLFKGSSTEKGFNQHASAKSGSTIIQAGRDIKK